MMDCATPISTGARALPAMISYGDIGVTINISKVPCSRSRATDNAVIINVCKKANEAISAGMIFQRDSKLGLYQARVSI